MNSKEDIERLVQRMLPLVVDLPPSYHERGMEIMVRTIESLEEDCQAVEVLLNSKTFLEQFRGDLIGIDKDEHCN